MKILYLSHRIPYPPNKGDKIRSFNEIKHLSKRHEIHLACLADNPRDLKYAEDLKKYCKTITVVPINQKLAKLKSAFFLLSRKPLSIPYFWSSQLQESIDLLLSASDIDCIFCFSSPMAEYVFKSKFLVSRFSFLDSRLRKCDSYLQLATRAAELGTRNLELGTRNAQPKLIMDFVDVDSDKWAQYAKYARFPKSWIYRLESRRLSVYERRVAEAFDHSIFVTEAEVEVFKKLNPRIQNVTAIQNGVDLEYFSPAYHPSPDSINHGVESGSQRSATSNQKLATRNQHPIIVFTGAMDYYANVDGVVWFSKEIFPIIKKEVPEVEFYIVGSNPAREVQTLSQIEGITVTGYVPDSREYLRKAMVAVVPLRIARGIQNKILEAMSMGTPVVATPQAFEGIETHLRSNLLIEKDTEAFSKSVVKLIKEMDLRQNLSKKARIGIESHYSWTKNISKLDVII